MSEPNEPSERPPEDVSQLLKRLTEIMAHSNELREQIVDLEAALRELEDEQKSGG